MLLAIARRSVVTAVLAGFGRTISEVGAVLIVGGNIAGYTRIMTTAIVLKTSEGELGLALCRFQQPVERDPQAPGKYLLVA
jgi:tungstate transport system permease protein